MNLRDKLKKEVLELLLKNNITVSGDCIKIWSCDTMRMTDVALGCNYVKRIGYSTIVYTNKVPNKEYVSNAESVNILDVDDLKKIALKDSNYEVYDLLDRYRY